MPQTPHTSPLHKVTFRLPEDLYQAIRQLAQADTRPINSQVIVLLREAITARTPPSVQQKD
jgi:hypothetical protein